MKSTIKTPWEKAVDVKPVHNFQLHLTMEGGKKLDLDLTSLITNREIFWRLKNFRYFQKVSIDLLGGLCWPEGEDSSPRKMLSYVMDN